MNAESSVESVPYHYTHQFSVSANDPWYVVSFPVSSSVQLPLC